MRKVEQANKQTINHLHEKRCKWEQACTINDTKQVKNTCLNHVKTSRAKIRSLVTSGSGSHDQSWITSVEREILRKIRQHLPCFRGSVQGKRTNGKAESRGRSMQRTRGRMKLHPTNGTETHMIKTVHRTRGRMELHPTNGTVIQVMTVHRAKGRMELHPTGGTEINMVKCTITTTTREIMLA